MQNVVESPCGVTQTGKLLLVLASTVILVSESRGTHDHILLAQDFHLVSLQTHKSLAFYRIFPWRTYAESLWKSHINNTRIYKSSPYLTGNTLRLCYKAQPVGCTLAVTVLKSTVLMELF
jgi:hypothetical protein